MLKLIFAGMYKREHRVKQIFFPLKCEEKSHTFFQFVLGYLTKKRLFI